MDEMIKQLTEVVDLAAQRVGLALTSQERFAAVLDLCLKLMIQAAKGQESPTRYINVTWPKSGKQ